VVRTDGRVAGRLIGEHLLERGFRSVMYADYAGSRWSAGRADGLRVALAQAGLVLRLCDAPVPSLEGGRSAAAAWFQGRSRPDAVVGYNDMLATGFMRELQTRGVRVPQDVGIAGIDNVPLCALFARVVRDAVEEIPFGVWGTFGATRPRRLRAR